MHQERHYPGRVSATDLVNPDFAALAKAYGAHGERSRAHGGLPRGFRRGARGWPCPPLLAPRVDPEAMTPRQTLTEIRESRSSRARAS